MLVKLFMLKSHEERKVQHRHSTLRQTLLQTLYGCHGVEKGRLFDFNH